MNNWKDATAPPAKHNGPVSWLQQLSDDELQLLLDTAYEHEIHTGQEITVPELREKVEHPGS